MPFVTMYALNACDWEYELEQMLLHLPLNWNEKILFKIPSKFSQLIEKCVRINSSKILQLMEVTIYAVTDLDRAKHLETK